MKDKDKLLAEHDFTKLEAARAEVRRQLIAAQLLEWPDSRIMTAGEVMNEWFTPDDFMTFPEWCMDRFNRLMGDNDAERRNWWNNERERHDARYFRQMAGALGCILANGMETVFYECGKPDEKGNRFRGARFGVEGSQYASGFPGGKL